MSEEPIIIENISLDWGEMPVRVSFSYGRVETFPFFVARIRSGEHEGIGDSVVETTENLYAVLQSLPGCDARELDRLLPDVPKVVHEGISIALHDLVGRVSGLPLNELLGGAREQQVPLMPCLFPNDAGEAAVLAKGWIDQGYRSLKVKLTGNLESDLGRVESIRAMAPEEIVLQGDANEGYETLEDAARAVRELGAAGLNIFEDPLRGGPAEYAELRGRAREGDAKIMVDVLARRTDDLVEVLKLEAADFVGIHPVQPCSLSRAIHHTRLAQESDVPVVIGGTGYTGISSAAYQHLAAVVTPGGVCGELGGFFDHGMPRNLAAEPLPMKDGAVILPKRPGHGVELNEDALADFVVGSRTW